MKKLLFIIALVLSANFTQAQWGPDVRLTNDTSVSIIAPHQSWSATAKGDTVHVVWYDGRDGNFEIYYKRSTDGGINWGADVRLTNDTANSSNPGLAVSGSNVHVVWQDFRDGNREIYYKHSLDGGTTWSSDIRLTNDTALSYCACIAVSGSDVHVSWTDLRDGNNEIYYKHSTDVGITWGNDTRITNDAGSSYNTSVSVSGSKVHIIWNDNRDGNLEIYYNCSTDGGVNWGTDIRLTIDIYTSNLPIMAISGTDLHIVWMDTRNYNFEIYYKRSTDAGLTWGADTRLTNASGGSLYAKLAVSGSRIHIVWQDDRNGNTEIFYKCSEDGGLSWSSDTLLVNNNVTMSERPSLVLCGSMVHVIWSDKRDGPNGEIYYKRNPTGNLIGIEDLDIDKNNISVYPNPFSDYTNIEFEFANSGNVEINIYNQMGIQIQTLKCSSCQAGKNTLQWDCLDLKNNPIPSGIYYCKVLLGKEILTKKMIVVN